MNSRFYFPIVLLALMAVAASPKTKPQVKVAVVLPSMLPGWRIPDDGPPLPAGLKPVLTARAMAALVVLPPDTNSIFHRTFRWEFRDTSGPAKTFTLEYGKTKGGPWPNVLDVRELQWSMAVVGTNLADAGVTNFCEFWKTNWIDADVRHYYVMRAARGMVSEPSNETFWPPYPNDRMRISWQTHGPTTVLWHTNLTAPKSLWMVLTNVVGTNVVVMTDKPRRFYTINRRETLEFHFFNPLNDALLQ